MSGYMICHGACVACRNLFSFNPDLVPSISIDGHREPICKACVERVNPMRKKNGLPPIQVLPGAYEPQEVA